MERDLLSQNIRKRVALGLVLTVLLFYQTIYSQTDLPALTGLPDTLKRKLLQLSNGTSKIDFLLLQIEHLQAQHTELAYRCANLALLLSEEEDIDLLKAQCLFWMAYLQLELESYNEAKKLPRQRALLALELFQKHEHPLWLIRTYILTAEFFYQEAKPVQAAKQIKLASTTLKSSNLPKDSKMTLTAEILYTKGKIAFYENRDSVKIFLRESLLAFRHLNDHVGIGKATLSLAAVEGKAEKEPLYLAAIEIFKSLKYQTKLQVALIEYGVYCINRYESEGAHHWFEKSLTQFTKALRTASNNWCEIRKQLGIANHWKAYYIQEDETKLASLLDSAAANYKLALALAEEEGNFNCMQEVAHEMAKTCMLLEDCSKTIEETTEVFASVFEKGKKRTAKAEQELKVFQLQTSSKLAKQRLLNFILAAISIILGLIGLFYLISQRQRIVYLNRRLKAEHKARIAQRSASRAQMNPHFISNTLAAIDNLVNFGTREKASHYLIQFDRLCRKVIANSRKDQISLQEEIDTLGYLLSLEQLRLPDQLTYSICIEETLVPEEISFPPLLLQPFVENAIWHGIQKKQNRGHLQVEINKNGEHQLLCIIEDNGVGREKSKLLDKQSILNRHSLGNLISQERIDAIEGGEKRIFDLKDQYGNPEGTRVEIILPLKKITQ